MLCQPPLPDTRCKDFEDFGKLLLFLLVKISLPPFTTCLRVANYPGMSFSKQIETVVVNLFGLVRNTGD